MAHWHLCSLQGHCIVNRRVASKTCKKNHHTESSAFLIFFFLTTKNQVITHVFLVYIQIQFWYENRFVL